MFNILDKVQSDTVVFRQLSCDDQLLTEFNCPLERPLEDLWSHENFFVHMLEGRKGWYSLEEEVLLHAGETAFVRKGATLLQQYLDHPSCVVLFFVSDEFICETLRSIGFERDKEQRAVPNVVRVNTGRVLQAFFQGMLAHFQEPRAAQPELVRLKFRELLLSVVNDPENADLLAYFCSLLNAPVLERVRRVMEDNYSYNLELEDLARLSGRSLAAFKRDVQELFGMPPGRWIRHRRLERARALLAKGDLQVSEVAFQCGFENLSHFSRAFKEEFGATPASLRGVLAH
ncbi:MAG: helix-turn-helix transcriptional regulator [Flavobacteriales bacterium]|nr:helix-turn-helix transcriptional regulator [Flavobacteriales bacterium]